VEPLQLGIAMDERRLSLGAPRAVVIKEPSVNGHTHSIAKLVNGSTMPRMGQRFRSISGPGARKGSALERFEPCEAKVSRTVLRGAWAG
jgi:hypothetical protein